MTTFGGYDFEVVGEVAKECQCPICLLLIKDAIELPCTHGLCTTCLRKWEQANQERNSGLLCPSCKVTYDEDKVQRSKMLDRLITTSLKVKCKENENGCNWIGTISDYKEHEMNCLFKSVQCNYHGCDITAKQSDLKEHQKICQFRVVQCNYCEVEEQFNKLDIHYQMCNLYPMNCIHNECDATIPRSELEDHIQNHCNFQMIHCGYEAVGCHAIIQRKDLHTHIDTSSSMQYHMTLLLQNYIVTTADLNSRLSNVEELLARTTQELEETKDTLHVTKEKLETITIDADRTKAKLLYYINAIKNETEISKKQLEDNILLTNQKFEEIKENTTSIEDNCLRSTKVLALMNTSTTPYMGSANNGLLKDLMNILNIPEKVHKLTQEKELDFYLEKDYGITLINKGQTERKQHIELLDNLTYTYNNTYDKCFMEVSKNMEECKLYYTEDTFYVKFNLAEHVGKAINATFININAHSSRFNSSFLKKISRIKQTNDGKEVSISVSGGRIFIWFYMDDKWMFRNTECFIVHPKEEKEMEQDFNEFHCKEILLQKYLCNGEILIKVKKTFDI